MSYIHFTEEQKLRASEVDLVEFLRRQGEKLIRSGPEYRLDSDHREIFTIVKETLGNLKRILLPLRYCFYSSR